MGDDNSGDEGDGDGDDNGEDKGEEEDEGLEMDVLPMKLVIAKVGMMTKSVTTELLPSQLQKFSYSVLQSTTSLLPSGNAAAKRQS